MAAKFITRRIEKVLRKSPKSVLLLGPRQVGKSTLVESLEPDLMINLSDELEFLRFTSTPGELARLVEEKRPHTIYIDEIQRAPRLLNDIQAILDKDKSKAKYKFFLTGSSARKLRRGGANLLPGRVLNFQLGPFVASEFDYQMDTVQALEYGTLPEVYLTKDIDLRKHLLRSYSASYLKEEIKAEALTRNLESFARFLNETVMFVGQFVDYTKLSKRAKISRHACPRYFEILEDTLIGHRIFPFGPLTEKLDLIRHPKFYFFDNGVYNGLLGNYQASMDRKGVLAEQLVHSQILHSAQAQAKEVQINSFRTRGGAEVDFIVTVDNEIFGIEVKSQDQITMDDVEGLKFFKSHHPKMSGLFLFHMGTRTYDLGPVVALPWQEGLQRMGL